MSLSIQALEKQYQSLRELLSKLEAKGVSEEQLNTLREAVAKSRDNWAAAVNSNLQDDDPEVKCLTSQLIDLQEKLDHWVTQLGEVAKVLSVVTKAVGVGSQVLAKAATI